MSAFQVEPAELAEAARALGEVAERLRAVAVGTAGLGALRGTRLLGGLDDAVARAAERWADGHRALADSADALGWRLSRAASLYGDVDDAVARSAGG